MVNFTPKTPIFETEFSLTIKGTTLCHLEVKKSVLYLGFGGTDLKAKDVLWPIMII